ncbi:hypothetical protein SESBI_30035 [Sesbania bispinosa]|nr:hypothetical protein SESBI_30035 [Sesbania bispinosa]
MKTDNRDSEIQHTQDLPKDVPIAINDSLYTAQETQPSVVHPHSDQSNKELGNYGPWMLVRKQPRKQAPGKYKDSSPRTTTPHRDRPIQGSRFDTLKKTEDQETGSPKGDQVSVTPPITSQEQHYKPKSTPVAEPSKPIPKVIRIRNPKAGKNSQQSQEKRKQKILKSQKSAPMLKTSPAIIATTKQQQLNAVPNQVMIPEKGGGQINRSKLQHEYMMALGSGHLEPKPPDINHAETKRGNSNKAIQDTLMQKGPEVEAETQVSSQDSKQDNTNVAMVDCATGTGKFGPAAQPHPN